MAKKNVNNGFIKIDRSILDWEHITEPVVLQVFLYLLLKANHKAKWHNGKMCERGATFVSIRTMCEDLAMSPHTAIKALRTLEESGEVVRREVTQKLSKTKLVNYSKYQGNNGFSVAENATQSATQNATQTATKQERKERKEDTSSSKEKESTHDEVLNWFVNSQYLEQFAMTEGITPEFCRKLAEDITTEWKMVGKTHRSVSDSKQHLLNHIRKAVATMREKGTLTATVEKAKRLQPLIDGCKQLKEAGFKHEDVAEFYSYWTQPTTDGTGRMRFEKQDAWDTIKRFKTFYKIKKR